MIWSRGIITRTYGTIVNHNIIIISYYNQKFFIVFPRLTRSLKQKVIFFLVPSADDLFYTTESETGFHNENLLECRSFISTHRFFETNAPFNVIAAFCAQPGEFGPKRTRNGNAHGSDVLGRCCCCCCFRFTPNLNRA